MKETKLHTILILWVFFLSLSVYSQRSNQKFPIHLFETSNSRFFNSSNSIQVISIIDNMNLNEIIKMDQRAAQYKGKNVKFIAVTDTNKEQLNKYFKTELSNYIQLTKENNKLIFNTYQTGMYKIFPIHVIINNEGKIIYLKKGNSNNIENKLVKRIDKLLKTETSKRIEQYQYTIR